MNAETIYDHFLEKYNQLEDNIFHFKQLIKTGLVPPERKIVLITAFTQQGKTFLVIAAMCIHLALGHVPVIVLKDRIQMRQFVSRLKSEMSQLNDERFKDYLYLDSKSSLTTNEFIEQLKKCQTQPKPIILIHSQKHVARVNKHLTGQCVLFIDEAHKLGGYKSIEEQTEPELEKIIKYDQEITALKSKALKTFLITATPQDILISEKNLFSKGILSLKNTRDYIGLHRWNFARLESDSPYDNLMHLLEKLSQTDPVFRQDKFGQFNLHPICLLTFAERINEIQFEMLQTLMTQNNPSDSIKAGRWTIMTLNQNGIILTSPSLENTIIELPDERALVYDGICKLVKSQISDVLQWLAENGGVLRFPRILIISFKSAEEGVSFCSTWSNDPQTDYSWHLTHVDAGGFSKAVYCSIIEQRLGRINGNHGDNIIPTIYCSENCQEKIIKGFVLHTEQIQACLDSKEDVPVRDLLLKLNTLENHYPRQYFKIPTGWQFMNLVFNPNEQIENSFIQTEKSADMILTVVNPHVYSSITNKDIDYTKAQAEQLKIEWQTKQQSNQSPYSWSKLLAAYQKKKGKVYAIITAFRNNKFQPIDQAELVKICKGKFQYNNYDHWDDKHNKYHIINRVGQNLFSLRADVIEKLEL